MLTNRRGISAVTALSAEVCQVISEQSRQFDEIVAFLE